MQWISKCNKGFRFLLSVIDIYCKYVWLIPSKHKKVLQLLMLFKKVRWIKTQAKVTEFYNRSMKSFLQNNDVEMYSTHNEGKSVIAKRFIRILKIEFINVWFQYQKICILIN